MATDPPYLVDYEGGNHPQTWGTDGRPISAEAEDKHWDAYIDHEHSVAFYRDFLGVALEHALSPDAAVYQWFGHAHAESCSPPGAQVGLLRPPGADLEKEPRRC